MSRRGKRTNRGPYQRREVLDKDAGYAAMVRKCCPSSVRLPHTEDCQRNERACRNKVPFPTRDRARARAAEIRATSNEHMTEYRCPSCNRWHLGHPRYPDV